MASAGRRRPSAGVPSHTSDGLYAVSAFSGWRRSQHAQGAIGGQCRFANQLFWDGRAGPSFTDPQTGQVLIAQGGALESQSLATLAQHGGNGTAAAQAGGLGARIIDVRPLALATSVPTTLSTWIAGRNYPALFAEAFGSSDITAARIAMAIASYERTLVANQTPIDSQFAGTPSSLRWRPRSAGFTATDCAACHAGSLFSDNQFHYIGVRPVTDDLGRFTVTANNAIVARSYPQLRNVALRAPYMHNGRLASLEDVVEFYNRGGDFNAPNKDPRVRPRNLSPQQENRPCWPSCGGRSPTPCAGRIGSVRAASAVHRIRSPAADHRQRHRRFRRRAPLIGAIEPPLLGNRNFTVELTHALGAATATLVISHDDPGVQAVVPVGDFANLVVSVAGSGPGLGTASVNVDLGSNPDLIGQTLHGRFYIVDPAGANGVAVTQAFRISVFGDGDRIFGNAFD